MSLKKPPVAVYPLFGIVSLVLGGMTYVGLHALNSPDIQLSKKNPQAWNQVKPNDNTKLTTSRYHTNTFIHPSFRSWR